MTQALALIVDDEPDILELLDITLSRMNISSKPAQDLAEAKRLLKTHHFDICLTDLQLPDGNGLELVKHIQKNTPNLPIAVITAFGSMDTAVKALKLGAFDFVSKPVDLKSLKSLVSSAIKINDTTEPVDRRSRDQLLGDSVMMANVRAKIAKLARSQAPIYISGESGTGKELVAKLIHEKGPRSHQPFVPINCGAIPQELMESEFFGHKKGSFTGAIADKPGLFQTASGGTLFLDEVADLPLHMQVKLLRAIQEKSIRPIGSDTEQPIDVRILSATHKNLPELVEQGNFRQDLYYRINVIELPLPPLRERAEDITQLAKHILQKLNAENNSPTKLTDTALKALAQYTFPGNVRELENILERAFTLCENGIIHQTDLQLPNNTKDAAAQTSGIKNPTQKTSLPTQEAPLEDYLDSLEKEAITNALEKTRWNKTAAAKELGISFRALRYRLKKLGLND
ncbi:sigma-54-dependent transcriptional regulator [Cycloclasticus zancles]|uniref:Sigma-54-dependent Fis family transcriptional regulator n=1 Tax=Cycloclasticus zancles 78-ME TaxID=1198232 RepID=S5U0B6_9GAMM|nr:sigma-54 dependent transcriptional regulator [Cycloclasticus zancles]AGS40683.1 Sigma-54-dependent Fis family transcriptional regulator [Cycloclasticus zancles 78-ME]